MTSPTSTTPDVVIPYRESNRRPANADDQAGPNAGLMHVKLEPTEDARENSSSSSTAVCGSERPMDMSSALHSGAYPSHHQALVDSSRLHHHHHHHLQQQQQHVSTTSADGSSVAPMRTLGGYHGYEVSGSATTAFDQRLMNTTGGRGYPMHPAYTTPSTPSSPSPSSTELARQEKLQKELSNYMLQNNIPSSTMMSEQLTNHHPHVSSPSSDLERSDSEMSNVLTMKRSNGKLAIPDMLNPSGLKDFDLAQTLNSHQRAKREFVPDEKKDEGYWTKRVKNNDSARRSRVKRKALEKIMESRLMELQQENIELRHELNALKRRYGLPEDGRKSSSPDGSMSSSPSTYSHSKTTPASLCNKDDELEHQSSASDDSRSLDDARCAYNVRSASVLSQSLDPSRHRDRADSVSSCGSASANRSPNSNSPLYTHNFVRTDKSGALDLTSDFVGPRPPLATTSTTSSSLSRDYSSITSPPAPGGPNLNNMPDNINNNDIGGKHPQQQMGGEKMETSSLRGFPLKCRWKLSSSTMGPAGGKPTVGDSTPGSFPGA